MMYNSAMRNIDMAGQKFGRLTVLARVQDGAGATPRWMCVCDCGGKKTAYRKNIRRGLTTSCGCVQRERAAASAREKSTTHGMSRDPRYQVWRGMLDRCTNPTNKAFPDYGGRGISVCARWLESPAAFAADMGPRPRGMTIDRIDGNGNYEPGNCRWAPPIVQNNNRRDNIRVVYRGAGMTLMDAIRASGTVTSEWTIRHRLDRGIPLEEALL